MLKNRFVFAFSHKGLCFKKAEELGIRTAKFPLDEYIPNKTGFSRVLTTNHCVDVLLELLCSNFDWHQSCKRGVPLRKLKIRKPKKDESTEFNEINEDDFSVDSSNETQEIHAHRTKTCLVFGIENVDVDFLHNLFMKAWSILIVGSSQDTLKKAIADIKNGNKEGGEIGFGIVDFVSEGEQENYAKKRNLRIIIAEGVMKDAKI